jgi:hypothetical protein
VDADESRPSALRSGVRTRLWTATRHG